LVSVVSLHPRSAPNQMLRNLSQSMAEPRCSWFGTPDNWSDNMLKWSFHTLLYFIGNFLLFLTFNQSKTQRTIMVKFGSNFSRNASVRRS
jgi:capsule polysaccharide modification protein KpsS